MVRETITEVKQDEQHPKSNISKSQKKNDEFLERINYLLSVQPNLKNKKEDHDDYNNGLSDDVLEFL